MSLSERWAAKMKSCGFPDAPMVRCGSDSLPAEAAPCLDFAQASNPAPIWEVFGGLSAADQKRLAPYRMIGSDGAGNPICLADGAVVLLDHENNFGTVQFVNTSVAKLGECLLAYMGEQDAERFRTAVRNIDPPAMDEGSFWFAESAGIG